jgi:hypothetical protein
VKADALLPDSFPVPVRRAYAFRAELDGWPGVVRTIAVAEDQTLEQLHEALRLAYGWADPHLYSFWLSGEAWSGPETEYTAPQELEMSEGKSAQVPVGELGLRKGKRIAYVFDFGDQWQVSLQVVDSWAIEDEAYPMLVEAEGAAPPQYAPDDEEE